MAEVTEMEYEQLRLIKRSEKGIVELVREKDSGKPCVRKLLNGRYPVYAVLKECVHPGLPRLYEVIQDEDTVTVIEEYIEGQSLGSVRLSEGQIKKAVRELCQVLEFLHGKGIIHRDIKPSNILLAADGHIRLIDFDAARMQKDDLEQDTRLLGTRGYAPPEQYGFAQTDERTDIYALGVTLRQLLGTYAQRLCYKRILLKCTELDPDKRYQSVRQVRRAFAFAGRFPLWVCGAVFFFAVLSCVLLLWGIYGNTGKALTVLPAPDDPHWDGETGTAVWENVPDSGEGGAVAFRWRLYRSKTPPAPDSEDWLRTGMATGNLPNDMDFLYSLVSELEGDGTYYFTVSALGDGVHFADSPYAVSDAFTYTGEDAPPLPAPTGLAWKIQDGELGQEFVATWDNLEEYADKDIFDVWVYDKSGTCVTNSYLTKEDIVSLGRGGIRIRSEYLSERGNAWRFTVRVYTSRPNEYRSFEMPEPVPEAYLSPWCYYETYGVK